jgi:hypothetical protein
MKDETEMAKPTPKPESGISKDRKQVPTAANAPSSGTQSTPDEIRRRIAEAAYYRAERRGFSPGYEEEDWIAAEQEIRRPDA